MLSPPWIATQIVKEQVVTCTFYIIVVDVVDVRVDVDNTRNKGITNNTSNKYLHLHEHVKRPHGITMLDYYLCCLCVLPSHLLGMSQWISSSESQWSSESSSASSSSKTTSEMSSSSSSSYLSLLEDKTMSKRKVLRKFQYSYYCGMFHVTTYHLAHTNDNDDDKQSTSSSKFHLVEFFDYVPRYYARWLLHMFVINFYIGIVALLALPFLF